VRSWIADIAYRRIRFNKGFFKMISVSCLACQKIGQVPDDFAGKRIKCVACGLCFWVEVSPNPEAETGFEISIPAEIFGFTDPVQKPLVARTTEIDVFVVLHLAGPKQPPCLSSNEEC
jgi:hypothetical protein